MARLFKIIFLIVWSTHFIFAQHQTDSIAVYHHKFASAKDSISKYKALSIDAHSQGDMKAFKAYSQIMLDIAKSNSIKEEEISAFMYLGIYYQQREEYTTSLSKYLEAEKLSESLPEKSNTRILVQVNLGNLYNRLEDYENVKLSMKKVIAMASHQQDNQGVVVSAYNSLGTANLNQGNYIEALAYMNKVKDYAEKTHEDTKITGALINIAECQRHLGYYDQAIANSQKALSKIVDKPSSSLVASSHVIMGISYYLSNRPKKAFPNLKKARDIATLGDFLYIKMEAHQYLAKTYEALDSIKHSLEEQKAYIETREQYLRTLSKAQRLRVEKESEAKSTIITQQEQSIAFLSKEKQVYVFVGCILAVLLIVFSIINTHKRKRLAEESLQLKGDKALLKNENESLRDKLSVLAKKNLEQSASLGHHSELTKHKKSSFTKDDQNKYMKLILDHMDEEKPYLDHEIKQSDIAKRLNMSIHLFSEVLNVCFQKNFNNFINLYRVNKAKQLIKDPNFTHYKILAIGYEAGFPSKSSFNRVFKDLVGYTPTQYQKMKIS